MKTAQDFRRALGPADPGFERAMDQALSRLQKEEKPVKKKMPLSLVLALILLTLTLGTALATGMGVFGQLSQHYRKLDVIDQDAQKNDTSLVLPEGKHGEIPVSFSISQSFYDGESLYFSYAMDCTDRIVCSDVPSCNPENANFIDIWAEDAVDRRLMREQLGGIYEAMLEKYRQDGTAGATKYTAYMGDSIAAEGGELLETSHGDEMRQGDQTVGFLEISSLPAALQNQPEIVLHATVYRSRIYYLLTAEGLYQWADPDREITDVAFTVKRNAQAQLLGQGTAQFASYAVTAQLTQSGGLLICDITLSGMPESWLAWDSWAQVEADGLDFVYDFRLYADGSTLEPLEQEGENAEMENGQCMRMTYRLPENTVGEYVLRPVYSLSGENTREEISLELTDSARQ